LAVVERQMLLHMNKLIAAFTVMVATAIVSATTAAAAAPAVTVTTVPGTDGASGVGCATPTSCIVDAYKTGTDIEEVVPIAKTALGKPTPFPANTGVEHFACVSASLCLGAGGNRDGGAVIPVVNGLPKPARAAPNTMELHDMACPTPTRCVAVGLSNGLGATVVDVTNGVPGRGQNLSIPPLVGVACASPALCLAVTGDGGAPNNGYIVPITNGVPG
jgi:hypothetical protein